MRKFKPQVNNDKYTIYKDLESQGIDMYSREAIGLAFKLGLKQKELDEILANKSKYAEYYATTVGQKMPAT